MHRTLTDAVDSAVPACLQRGLVEYLDLEPGLSGDLVGLGGERFWIQVRGAGVHQVPDQGYRLADHLGPVERTGHVPAVRDERQVRGWLAVLPVPAEVIAAEHAAERYGLGRRRIGGRQRERDLRHLG